MRHSQFWSQFVLDTALVLVGVVLYTLLISCTNEDGARRALTQAGYKQIVLTGRDWWGCSGDDSTCTGFSAISPSGVRVEGAVGCGFTRVGKGCTIRTY